MATLVYPDGTRIEIPYKFPYVSDSTKNYLKSKYGKEWLVGFMYDDQKLEEAWNIEQNGIPKKIIQTVDIKDAPEELIQIVQTAISEVSKDIKDINKTINFVVGQILKKHKYNPALVKGLVTDALTNSV